MEMDTKKRSHLNLSMSAVAVRSCLAGLLGSICFLCMWDGDAIRVRGGAALTRSPKNTSLVVKVVRSHGVFLLHSHRLSQHCPCGEEHMAGEYQTELSITWISLRQSRENAAKLNNTSPGLVPQLPSLWHPLPTGYSKKCVLWLTRSHLHMAVKSS